MSESSGLQRELNPQKTSCQPEHYIRNCIQGVVVTMRGMCRNRSPESDLSPQEIPAHQQDDTATILQKMGESEGT